MRPIAYIRLIGHTDNTEKRDYNGDLGNRRARAVKEALEDLLKEDILKRRIAILLEVSPGGLKWKADNRTPQGRGLNPRVEVFVAPPEPPPPRPPLNVDSAIEKHKAWQARDDALALKIETTADDLRAIIDERIKALKDTQAEALKGVVQRKTEQLEREAAIEGEKATLLKKRINGLKALLKDLDKSTHAAAISKKQ